jgi:hypothetical protein
MKEIYILHYSFLPLSFWEIGSEVTGTDAMGSVFFKLLSVFAEFYAK